MQANSKATLDIVGGQPIAKETISDATVGAKVSANLDTGAVHLEFSMVDEAAPNLRARVVLEIPDLGEAEVFAYRILDAIAEIQAAHKAVAVPPKEGGG